MCLKRPFIIYFLVQDVRDPVALMRFARSLQSTQDPGILYRRFCTNVRALESVHLVGHEVGWEDELRIRKIVRPIVDIYLYYQPKFFVI